jgi:hypothetical protein
MGIPITANEKAGAAYAIFFFLETEWESVVVISNPTIEV